MLGMEHIRFSYRVRTGRRKTVLEDFSLTLRAGECVVLTGPNGAGKSTVLALLAGILRPDAGKLLLPERIGYIPQGEALFGDMTARDNLRFFAAAAKCPPPLPDSLPCSLETVLHRRVDTLSGGTRKRLSIACALLGDPPLLLFDEPCAGLDILYREELSALLLSLKHSGRAIVYVGHDPAEYAAFYDRLLVLGPHGHGCFSRPDLSQEGDAGDPALLQSKIRPFYLPENSGKDDRP